MIKKLADKGKLAVLWGYIGETLDSSITGQRVQKLYLDLTRTRWLEIDVHYIETSQALEAGRGSLVWVPENVTIAEVRVADADEYDVAYGFLSGGFWHQSAWSDEEGVGPPASTRRYGC